MIQFPVVLSQFINVIDRPTDRPIDTHAYAQTLGERASKRDASTDTCKDGK